MSEPEKSGAAAPPRQPIWRNWWVQTFAMSLGIAVLVLGWMVYQRGWWLTLPRLPSFESIRNNDEPAQKLAKALDLPALPDLTKIDKEGAQLFYNALVNLRNFPKVGKHYGALGCVLEAQGLRDEAQKLYRLAVEKSPDDYEWHYYAARLADQLGDTSLARIEYRKTIELRADYAPAYLYLGRLLLGNGELDGAKSMFDSYVRLRPNDVHGYVERARLARERGDWNAVVEQVDLAGAHGDIGKAGHQLLGYAYQRLGDAAKAETHLRTAQTARNLPPIEDSLQDRVYGYQTSKYADEDRYEVAFAEGRYADALKIAKRLVETSVGQPNHAASWLKVAECNRELDEIDEALRAVAEALKLAGAEPEPHVEAGLIRLKIGDLLRAYEEAETAVKLRDGYALAHLLRGQVVLMLGAEPDVTKLRLSNIHFSRIELVRLATADFESVLKIEPTNIDAMYSLGVARGMLGMYDHATAALERTLELDPNRLDAQTMLAAARARDASQFWPATQPAVTSTTAPATGPTTPAP